MKPPCEREMTVKKLLQNKLGAEFVSAARQLGVGFSQM